MAYLYRTLGQNNNSGKLTISVWVKKTNQQEEDIVTSYYSGTYWGRLFFNNDGQLGFQDYRAGYIFNKYTTATFLDHSAWMHIFATFDHTLSSPTGSIYVNGVEQTLGTDVNYTQGSTSSWLTDYTLRIGEGSSLGGSNFNGLMSDLYFIQGYSHNVTDFGQFNSDGVWKPKTSPTVNYSSTGSNSCHLKFESSGNIALDSGDNNVTFSSSGTVVQTEDNPSNNFTILNQLIPNVRGNCALSAGATKIVSADAAHRNAPTTMALKTGSGKWYWEMKAERISTHIKTGIVYDQWNKLAQGSPTEEFSASNYGYAYRNDGNKENNGLTAYGSSYTVGDIIGIAFDAENRKLYFSKNGVWQNSADPAAGTGEAFTVQDNLFYYPIVNLYNADVSFNFGNGHFNGTAVASGNADSAGLGVFEYAPPTGYYALNTKNLATYG